MSGEDSIADIEPSVSPTLPVVLTNAAAPPGDDSDTDITISEDEEDLENADVFGQRQQSSPGDSASPHRQYKTVNGKKRVDMTPPDHLLSTAQKRARKLSMLRKVDRAIHEYIRCTALTRIIYGSNHWKLAESHVDLGEAYLDLKGYAAQAEYHGETARSIMLHGAHVSQSVQEKAEIYTVLIRMYYTLGRACTMMKKYSEAEQYLNKADRIAQERSHLDCVTNEECDKTDIQLFLAMARLHGKQKKHALASEKFDKSISLIEKIYGPDSMRLISVLHDYGRLEQSNGRYANHEKAISLFQQAHDIATVNHKQGSKETVDTALALAQAYASTGREEAEGSAESYLNECLAVCTTVDGPHHPRSLLVQDELARLLIRTNRHEEAMAILKSSINPKCQAFGDYSEQVSDTCKLMGSVHLAQGSTEKALHCYKKCYTIEKLVLGSKHRKTKDTLRTMELLLSSPGMANKFAIHKEDELLKRPRFNSIVNRNTAIGGFKPQL